MARKVKTGKARLDKWYRIAKEQGYRSRAAFKLIQLNRKYNFLNSANVLVDLCAAPGGWLQVATRYMPQNSIKIGIDLVSIKHVPGCITFQEDITTPKCLALIKKEIKNEKVDVVLNDGAPNVGANWSKDAYSQVELVLAAMKLACTVLKKGGTFVTKVFRSTDYNSLIWVFNKFFEKVEATKPAASRTQSAEIFIVCLRYIAPDYIDPKLFDARFVFKDTEADLLQDANADRIDSIDKLLSKKRNRQGYADDVTMGMHRTISFEDFLNCENPLMVFAKYNKLEFNAQDQEKYGSMAKLPEDHEEVIRDFKILGKREMQSLLKWRTKILRVLGRNKKKEEKENGVEEEKKEEEHNTDSELEDEIHKEKQRELKELRREKEKTLKKISKMREMAPQQVEGDEIDFDWNLNKKRVAKLGYVDVDDDDMEEEPLEKKKKIDRRDVEDNIELNYELKRNKLKKVEEKTIKRQEEKKARKYRPLEEEEFQLETIENGQNYEEDPPQIGKRLGLQRDSDDDDDEDDDSDADHNLEGLEALNASTVALTQNILNNSKWFDRDIFKQGISTEATDGLLNLTNPIKLEKSKAQKGQIEEEEQKKAGKNAADNDDEDVDDDNQIKIKTKKEKLKITSSMKASEKRKAKLRQDDLAEFLREEKDVQEFEKNDNKIEVVPALRYDDYDVDSLAEMRVLAQKMLRKKDREQIMEDSYNRYSRPVDEDAPQWFLDDENKHNHKIMPITKEEFKAEKERLLAIKNRPIKKIAEAKFRRKMQVKIKLKKAQNKAKDIMEQEGITETAKLKQVQGLYKKAMTAKKVEKKYIVSRRFNGKGKGGGKVGRNTRMVDSRLKKDKRAEKRLEKEGRGRRVNSSKGPKGSKASKSGAPKPPRKSKKRMVKRR